MSDVRDFDSLWRNRITKARLYLWKKYNGWAWRILNGDDKFTNQSQPCAGEGERFDSRNDALNGAWGAVELMGGAHEQWGPEQGADRIAPLPERTDEAVKAGAAALSQYGDQGMGPMGSTTERDYVERAHTLAKAMRLCLKVIAELEGGHRCVECGKIGMVCCDNGATGYASPICPKCCGHSKGRS